MHQEIVCGIDGATIKTGISWFVNGEYAGHKLINEDKIEDKDNRFSSMCRDICTTLEEVKPTVVCIERMHTLRNADAFRKLCKIMGCVQWHCIANNIKYVELSPAEWRKYAKNNDTDKIGRKREELKKWSCDRVKELFGIKTSDDIADAILIAYGYIQKQKGK